MMFTKRPRTRPSNHRQRRPVASSTTLGPARAASGNARSAVGRAFSAAVLCAFGFALAGIMVPAGHVAAATPGKPAVVKTTSSSIPVTVATGRWAGADRYATAAAVSAAVFAPGVPAVFITTGTGYADALSGSGAAGRIGAPILLVPTTGGIPATIAAELTRLTPRVIYVLGGTSVVPAATATALEPYATTKTIIRLAGTDRYGTSAAIAAKFFAPGVPVAFIASGSAFPDALAAGPAAARVGGPVLLVPSGATALPPAIAAELKILKPAAIDVLGGTTIITPALAAAAAAYAVTKTPTRYAGVDRFGTAVAVSGLDALKIGSRLLLASGLDFPDALAAGAAAAAQGDDLLLTDGPGWPATVTNAIAALAPTTIIAIGGTTSVPAVALDSAQDISQSQYVPGASFTAPTRITFTAATSVTVSFTTRAGLGTTIASATMAEETSPDSADGTCDLVTWQAVDLGSVEASSPYTFNGLVPNTCYRFGVIVVDADTGSATTYSNAVKTLAAWTGSIDLYEASAFVTQADWHWCVGASALETVNLITGTTNTSKASQQPVQAYAQAHSPYSYGTDAGSDPAGWAATTNHFADAMGYHYVNHTSFSSELAAVALALRETGRPVGVTVAHGSHAWIAVGFESTADPLTGSYAVTGLYITGSLYPIQQLDGYDQAPDTFMTAATLSGFMTPYHEARFPVVWESAYVTIEP